MQPVCSPDEMREVDARAEAEGTELERLIERAGTAAASAAISLMGGAYGRRVAVVAGKGNNGADGRVAARLLERRGSLVRVFEAASAPRRLEGFHLVIDAAYGTGFRGSYDAPEPGGAAVLAVDVPSGLDAATGEASPQAVRADMTVTFGALKPGLLLGEGRERAGELRLAPIGLPVPRAEECPVVLVTADDVVELLEPRPVESHKWQSALGVVAGSPGMYGAPSFVSAAAARSGAGMVRLGIPGAEPSDLPVSEAVATSLPLGSFDSEALSMIERCKALVVGPGLGTSRPTKAAVRRLVSAAPIPVVVDADALTALGESEPAFEVLGPRSAPSILTPHDGEFARLAGSPPGTDRVAAACRLASATAAAVLLKGSTTIVATPGGKVYLSTSGSAALATAGTGDVLSGIIGAFIARGLPPALAGALAAHVHGRAADRGHREGLVAPDLPELVAEVLSEAASDPRRRTGAG